MFKPTAKTETLNFNHAYSQDRVDVCQQALCVIEPERVTDNPDF